MIGSLLRGTLILSVILSLCIVSVSLIGGAMPYDGEIRYILRHANNTFTPYALDVLHHISYPMRTPIQASSAQWSPNNRYMIIRSEDATYLWDVVSENLLLVHASDVWLSWSPDGTHLVFLAPSVAGYQLYLANGDGTGAVAVMPNDFADFAEPVFSPDSTHLAFISNDDVYVMQLAYRYVRRFSDTDDRFEYHPIWSPDGIWIAYSSQVSDTEYHLRAITINRGLWRDFTLDARIVYPVWSEDSTYLYFIGQDFSTSAVYIADLRVEAIRLMQLSYPIEPAAMSENWVGERRTLRILWSANDGGSITVYEDDVNPATGELIQRQAIPMVGYPQIYDEAWLIYAENERICIQSRATGLTQDCFEGLGGSVVDLRWLPQEDFQG